jgi:hypothetical protein
MKDWFVDTVLKNWIPTVIGILAGGAYAAAEAYQSGEVSKEGLIIAAGVGVAGAVIRAGKKKK